GRTFWKPIHLQPMYQDCPCSGLPVAESIWERIVTLPCSTGISEKELEKVVDVVRSYFNA
ncbi:MAG: DegT/DnrJ/EryC1/StrS family aminotransferase, partial [Eubacterium sp.]|nr:DegT/DnrJ/EryC1/StrS family aminotransferase [Eubacterium sp.]